MASKRSKIEIDATGQAPGRLAVKMAVILMGKHKPNYQPHIDSGDKVVVLNADKIHFTGKKLDQKIYYHHSMHPGGLKKAPAKKIMSEDPRQVILLAVVKMLPKNKLRSARMQRISFK